jgi:hypothetical protein
MASSDVEATRAMRQAEVGASRTMIDRTEDRFGLKPHYLVADSAYGSAENLLARQARPPCRMAAAAALRGAR